MSSHNRPLRVVAVFLLLSAHIIFTGANVRTPSACQSSGSTPLAVVVNGNDVSSSYVVSTNTLTVVPISMDLSAAAAVTFDAVRLTLDAAQPNSNYRLALASSGGTNILTESPTHVVPATVTADAAVVVAFKKSVTPPSHIVDWTLIVWSDGELQLPLGRGNGVQVFSHMNFTAHTAMPTAPSSIPRAASAAIGPVMTLIACRHASLYSRLSHQFNVILDAPRWITTHYVSAIIFPTVFLVAIMIACYILCCGKYLPPFIVPTSSAMEEEKSELSLRRSASMNESGFLYDADDKPPTIGPTLSRRQAFNKKGSANVSTRYLPHVMTDIDDDAY